MDNQLDLETRETLGRVIPFRNYVAIGLGVIVGIGWVVYSGQWLQQAGPLGAILAFALGGLILMPIGACYAEMTSSLPVAGGELAFTYKAFGPMLGFLTAWFLVMTYVGLTAFETIAIGMLVESLLPISTEEALYSVQLGDTVERVSIVTIAPGIVVGCFLIWINYKGAKSSARVQLYIVYTMLVCTIVFVAIALVNGEANNLLPLFPSEGNDYGGWAGIAAAIVSVLVVVPLFMTGFDTIPQAAEESGVSMSPRQLGIAILASIAVGSMFYVLIILAVSLSMPWTVSSTLPMTTAAVFEEAFGMAWAAKLVLFTALLGLISTLNGMYIAASRVLFALGRGGLLPHWFSAVHAKYRTPGNSILFVGAVSLIGPFVGKSALTPIVNSGSFAFTVAVTATCAATIRLRNSAPNLVRPYMASAASMYSGIVISCSLILLMVLPQSPGQLGKLEFVTIAIWTSLGLIAYFLRQQIGPLSRNERDFLILGEYRG